MRAVYLLLLLYFMDLTCSGGEETAPSSGPYRVILASISKCKKTRYPMDPDPSMTISLEVVNSTNKSFMRGNLTVLWEQKQLQIKLKSYIWRNGKWKMTYVMNNLGCHGLLLHLIISAVGVKYDRKNCGFIKGHYMFNDVDIDPIQHIWANQMEYGRILWTSEVMARSSTITCIEFETIVAPLSGS